jgi:hypothetical protein
MKNNRKEFLSYFHQMSPSEKHTLEKQSLKDPFLSDALDGFEENVAALESIKKMDKRYYQGRYRFWKISGVFIIGLSVFLIYLNTLPHPEESKHKPKVVNAIQVNPIPKEKIQSFVTITKDKELLPEQIQEEFKEKDKGMVFRANENPVFPTEELVQLPLHAVGKIAANPIKKRSNFAMETYIKDLKVLDYRYYRKKVIQENTDLLTGTPATQEIQKTGANQKDYLEMSYMNFLSVTLHDFNRGEYKAALIGFDQILSTYPDDVNALFYSSLCLYNLKQFNLCEQRLKVIDLAKFDNFDEEQHWYLLLCYKSLGKSQEFIDLKQEIIRSNGFYASKAVGMNF